MEFPPGLAERNDSDRAREVEEKSIEAHKVVSGSQAQMKALAEMEDEIKGQKAQFAQDQEALASQREALDCRISECRQREVEFEMLRKQVEKKAKGLDDREAQVEALQQEWDVKMADYHAAQTNITQLQQEMEAELRRISQSKNDLLPAYGATEEKLHPGQPAHAGVPQVVDEEARESIQRFQKLCRDAKRRVVGH